MATHANALVIMAKAPVAGEVKRGWGQVLEVEFYSLFMVAVLHG